jgi:hypothetical protein
VGENQRPPDNSFNDPSVQQQLGVWMAMVDKEAPDWHFDYFSFRAEQCTALVDATIVALKECFEIPDYVEGAHPIVAIDLLFRILGNDELEVSQVLTLLRQELDRIVEADSDTYIKKMERETGSG